MKKVKLFFALFAMLALGVTNAWAQTVTWEKATSIAAGDVVVLVCESKTMELSGISTTSTKYGTGETYTSTPAGKYELTVEEGSSSGTFSFKNGSDYLYWSSGNSLNKTTTKNENASWKVTFSSGDATILNAQDNTRKLQWNASSPRFACYTGAQTAVQLYKKVISDEPADVIVKTLKSIAVEGATTDYETGDIFKFDGTCTATYGVTKNDVPQEDETKVVTPTSVSTPDMTTVGTQTITVTYTEGEATVSATYDITIAENTVTPGTYTSDLNNTFFNCATGGNGAEQSGRFNDILVKAGCKSTAQNKTNYTTGHVRFYTDSYLKISAPTGYVITSIQLTAATDSYKWDGAISVDNGTYTEDTKSWSGYKQEVQFDFAKQNRISSISVTYELQDLTHVDVPVISGYTEFADSTIVTITATEGLKVYYTLDDTDPTNASTEYTAPFVLTATTTVKTIAYNGENASDIASNTFKKVRVLTCQEAKDLCTTTESTDKYAIRGYVTSISYAYNSTNNNITFWMADSKDGGNVFEGYKAVPADNAAKSVKEGDYIELIGNIVLYNSTPETTEGGIYTIIPAPATPKYTITVSANPAEAGTVEGAGEYVQGTSATLTATPAEGYDFTCWTSGNDTVSTDNPLTLTVSADTALVANFAKKTFTIDVNVTPAESGTVTGLADRGVYEYGATATLTATPADNYEFVFWAAGEDTLSTETTYSFEVKDNAKLLAVFKYTKCTPLNAPVVTYTTTYNSATLTWEAVDNAEAYLVTVGNFFNQVKDTTYTAIRLEAATEYTYSVQAISGDPKAYCDSEATYGALTTAEAPAATLTLSENGETRNLEGDFRLNELVTLPTTAAECSKTFVGWDSKADCAVAPEYAPGAEYQLNELTQTLYAVYADAQPGETVTIAYSGSTTANMGTGNNADKVGLDATQWTVIADKGQASNNVGLNKEGTIRLYYHAGGSNTLTITAPETIATVVLNLKENNDNAWVKVGENTITPSTAGVYTIDTTTFVIGNANTSNVQVHIYSIEVTLIATEYTNYSTTCPAAPVVEVAPAEVIATVEGTEGEITVAYENVLLEKVAISLYNDQKCTEAFTGDWLTATLDADYNITYTVAASTLYTEREAYILLTAPAVDGTEPATALIPVTQAGKEAVFASLEELLANVTPTKDGINVTVTLTDEEIVEIFVTSNGYRNGVNLNVPYQNGTKKIQIYCYDVPESWVKGGKVSGTITCPWKDYNGTWELCPKSWDEITYTAPTTTALDNAVVAGKTTKMIINGQLIIVKDGVQYNAQGAQL